METLQRTNTVEMRMEQEPNNNIDPEHLSRREKAKQLFEDIENGVIVDPHQLKPRETSPEVIQMARARLRELGYLARKNYED